MKFKREISLDPRIAVHCKTDYEARQLLDWANEIDLKWRNGKKYLGPTKWHVHMEDTAYALVLGVFHNKQTFEQNNFIVISFNDASRFEKLVREDEDEI